ncbi:MAG: peptidylprolyl isomerase [Pirellulaceae bacterium]
MINFFALFDSVKSVHPRIARRSRIDTYTRLEPREVLSGNVQVFLEGNNWMMVGDDQSNFVRVDRNATGDLVFQGQDGTLINNSNSFTASQAAVETGFTGTLLGSFGHGNDRIAFGSNISLGGGVHLTMGKGDDIVTFDGSSMKGDFACIAGKGTDTIAIRNSQIGGSLILNTDKGNDTISLDSLQIQQDLLVDLGLNDDVIDVLEVTVGGATSLQLQSGHDTTIFRNSSLKNVFVSSGRGNDLIEYDRTTATGQVQVLLDEGNDQLRFASNTTIPANLLVDGHNGTDSANVTTENSATLTRTVNDVEAPPNNELIDGRLFKPGRGAFPRIEHTREFFISDPLPALTLTAFADATKSVASSGTLLTKQSAIAITGSTLPNSRIELSRDSDGLFNDGTVTAAANGTYTVNANLLNDTANRGANTINVRVTDQNGRQRTEELKIHLALGTVVRFSSSLGNMDFELLNTDTPNHVANFLRYRERYANSIVHRSARTQTGGDFIIQGGGFKLNGNALTQIVTDAPVLSEAKAENSNIRGTLALALPGDPDLGTSQWFINLANNSAVLDPQDFTVFGRVIGTGLEVADQIHDFSTFEISSLVGQQNLANVPLRNYVPFSTQLSGTVSTTTGSSTVTGVGTSFTTAIPADKRIQIGGSEFVVSGVISDTQLQLSQNVTTTNSNVVARVNSVPAIANYVSMNSIAELSLP